MSQAAHGASASSSAFACDMCGFALHLPISSLGVSWLGLYDDGLFPGRCLLVYERHVEHLTDLGDDESAVLIEDAQRAARAILEVTDALRVNYAILGNAEPHLHVHLIPRYQNEPAATRPPWVDPRTPQRLDPEEVAALRDTIGEALRMGAQPQGTTAGEDSTSDRTPSPPRGRPQSVLAARLAYCGRDVQPPDLHELGLARAKEAAFVWQRQRSHARPNELAWMLEDEERSEWVKEIHGLFGTIGELVLVAIEAEAEKTVIGRGLELPDVTSENRTALRAALSRSLRFFAEGESNYLVVAGHGAANLTLRTLVLHQNFQVDWVAGPLRIAADRFRPGALHRGAWISLSEHSSREVRAAAERTNHQPLVELADSLDALVRDPRWVELYELRAVQYHRWRGESPGVTGVNLGDPSMRTRFRRGEAVGMSGELLPVYQEGDTVLSDVVSKSRAGLDAVTDWMPRYYESWDAAFKALLELRRSPRS